LGKSRASRSRSSRGGSVAIDRQKAIAEAFASGRVSAEEHDFLLVAEWDDRERRLQAEIDLFLTFRRDLSDVDLARAAERRLEIEDRRARGEMPTTKRIAPPRDRRRMPTYERPPFHTQLGPLQNERDEREIAKLVAELRRQTKAHGLLPPGHDRRRTRH
jgi:hypothetical protein